MKTLKIDELLTGPEIAFLANKTKMSTFERWKLRNQGTEKTLPDPDWYFGLTPVWSLDTIVTWLEATSRQYDVEAWRKQRDAGAFKRKSPSNAVSR
jgi:hypothetical protein